HLGHLRNIFLGDSVASLLEAAGHSVKRVQIINDRGIHICKSMVAWKRFGNGETPESSGLKGDKLVGKYYVAYDKHYKAEVESAVQNGVPKEQAEKEAPILREAQEMLRAWEQKDPEVYALWEKMNGWVYDGFDVTYQSLGVAFDKLYYESETYLFGKEEVERGLSKDIFYRKEDGSVWVNLEDVGLDHKLLLRSDGTAVYMTQDIGTAIQRTIDFPEMSQMVYTVGNEQEYHFKVLFAVLAKLGYPWASQCHHLSYGMVELPEGKMKSREGTVVDADDLVEGMTDTAREISEELGKLEELTQQDREQLYSQIGGAALKYFLLKVDARKNMLFNPRESIDFNGNTGPFIQYAHARISSLLRKAADVERVSSDNLQLSESEQSLALKLDRFPVVVEESAVKYSPAELANYLYDLVKDFNSFYQSMPVLKEEDVALRTFRLELTEACGKVIRTGLRMLGIAAPERM
ncbi:MAG: arginine--tRNA ligase, partial [Cryomorphaceae bacterium]